MRKTTETEKPVQDHEKAEKAFRRIFSITEDRASNDEIRDRLVSGGKVTGTNMCVMICAILIASVGLRTDSVAVIIGAMLISPLMGNILAISYGTVTNDFYFVRNQMIGFVMQILISVTTATLYFLLSPLKDPTEQILARTQPGITDVIIAIAGGTAGIIGQTRKEKFNNIIPGVAIATALMPPLCTCGYCIANARWDLLAGSSYLFLINAYFIYASSNVILYVLNIPKVRELTPRQWRRLHTKGLRNMILILMPILVFFVIQLAG